MNNMLIDKSFYKSKEWRKCRDGFMSSKNYVCERCNDVASICHHKIYINALNVDDPNITLNWDNLEALCQTCHNQEHFKTKSTDEGLRFDKEGNIIKI